MIADSQHRGTPSQHAIVGEHRVRHLHLFDAPQLRRLVGVGHRSEPKSNGAEAEYALVFGFLHLIEEQYQPAAVRDAGLEPKPAAPVGRDD